MLSSTAPTLRLPRVLAPVTLILFFLPGFADTLERVSLHDNGGQALGGFGSASEQSLSADGRFVAFASTARLTDGDTRENARAEVFLRDRLEGTTTAVSRGTDGVEPDQDRRQPRISADGRFVVFTAFSDDPDAGDSNGRTDVLLFDRTTGTKEVVSLSTGGVQGNGYSDLAAISADGRFVAFRSFANNLVHDDSNGRTDIFVRDRTMGTTERVSLSSDGAESIYDDTNPYGSADPAISADGRFVAFHSYAINLDPNDRNGQPDIFVHDRVTATTERVNISSDGAEANADSFAVSMNATGRFVAFLSLASNLVANDVNGVHDVFMHDRDTGVTTRASVNSAGIGGNAFDVVGSQGISADGRFLTFVSGSDNLVESDTNGLSDVFVRDFVLGKTRRVNLGPNGVQSNGRSRSPSISADGRSVAFTSSADNLVAGDTNRVTDTFLVTLDTLVGNYTDLAYVADISANGIPEIATLRMMPDGTARIVVKDAQTQDFVSQVNFEPTGMTVAGLTVLQDLNGNGSPELALLLVKPDGRGRVYIKDALSTQWVTSVNFFNPDWQAVAISALDLNRDGVSEIAVLGVRDDGLGAAVQVIDSLSKTQSKWFVLDVEGASGTYLDLTHLDDANGNGVTDLAVLRRLADGSAEVMVIDGDTRDTLNTLFFDASLGIASQITGLADLDGNTAPELAVLGVATDGRALVKYKDVATGEIIGERTLFDQGWSKVAIGSDYDDQNTQIAVLGERDDQSATSAVIFDALSGLQLGRIPFAAGVE